MGKLIKELALAAWFSQSIFTIRRNRTAAPHRHPPYKKVGSSVLYDVDEVQKWLESRTINGLETPVQSVSPQPKAVRPEDVKTPKKEKRPGPGRPPKAETVRKSKNAGPN